MVTCRGYLAVPRLPNSILLSNAPLTEGELMSDLAGLIDLIPIDDIADKLGIDEKTAKSAVKSALPAIVAGLANNASTKEGEAALEKALNKHTSKSSKVSKVADVDEEDGKKIVSHVFGAKKESVTAAAAGKADVTSDIIGKILPIIAPIVLAWLAEKFLSGKTSTASKDDAPAKEKESSSGGGIGDILGGLIGSKEGQDMLGGILGGLLGGKK
jgi:hypothetical protein